MSSRTRRLAEIAKANEPVFSGTHWWLADPASKAEQAAKDPPPPTSPEPLQPQPIAVSAPFSEAQVALAECPSAVFHPAVPPQPAQTAVAQRSESEVASQPLLPNPSVPNQEPEPAELTSRLSGLREKFLWLGRKKHSAARG